MKKIVMAIRKFFTKRSDGKLDKMISILDASASRIGNIKISENGLPITGTARTGYVKNIEPSIYNWPPATQ